MAFLDLFRGEKDEIGSLVKQVLAAHEAGMAHEKRCSEEAQLADQKYRQAGEALLALKDRVVDEGGRWLEWLTANLPQIGQRQAQRYMQMARTGATLPELTHPASPAGDVSHETARPHKAPASPRLSAPAPEPAEGTLGTWTCGDAEVRVQFPRPATVEDFLAALEDAMDQCEKEEPAYPRLAA